MNKQLLACVVSLATVVLLLLGFGVYKMIQIQERPAKLFEAVRAGDVEQVQTLLDAGVPVDIRDENDSTPLIIATKLGIGVEMVTTLIEAGADIQAVDSMSYRTPLINACGEQSDREVIRVLLDAGADVNFQPKDENQMEGVLYTPLILAVEECDDLNVIDDLIDAGANVDAISGYGSPVLSDANSPEKIARLIEAGTKVNVASYNGFTPLMAHSSWGTPRNMEIVRLLVDAGADLESRSDEGKTALMWSAESNQTRGLIALIELGADIHARSNSGMTALMFAAQAAETTNAIILLLDAGADPMIEDDSGNTALDYLLMNDFYDHSPSRERLIEVSK